MDPFDRDVIYYFLICYFISVIITYSLVSGTIVCVCYWPPVCVVCLNHEVVVLSGTLIRVGIVLRN